MWTTAFVRYVAVYTHKFPFQAPALMTYITNVRDLAQKRHVLAFYVYDQ